MCAAFPDDVYVFLLGSRYCETDRLSQLAWSLFDKAPRGWARVQAICDYVHNHIRFDYQLASPSAAPTTHGPGGPRVCAATTPTWRSRFAAA